MKLVMNEMSDRASSWFANSPVELVRQGLSRLSVRILILVTMLCLGAPSAHAATFQVTTTADNGNNVNPTTGSLRKAILDANANPGSDAIDFNIPGVGVQTISPPLPLPAITGTVTIDGLTQPGAAANTLPNGDNAVLLIELDGTNAGALADGLHLGFLADLSTIRGLVINRFAGNAIYVEAGFGHFEGNFIGTDPSGTIVRGNGTDHSVSGGIRISGINNVIGGTAPAARNVIAGSAGFENYGVGVVNAVSPGQNVVVGNFIGTDKTGMVKLGNSVGVALRTSSNNTIGGTVAGSENLISGNLWGVLVAQGSNNNKVQGNRMGLDAIGLNPLGNSNGVVIQQHSDDNTIGGTVNGSGNVIAFNTNVGIFLSDTSKNNSFLGNSIFSNQKDGIALAGDVQLAAPTINSAKLDAAGTTVQATLTGIANAQFRVEFFVNPDCDASGFGEGKTLIGFANVQTNSNGVANIAPTFSGLSLGSFITATATDPSGNTSQFSNCQIIEDGLLQVVPQISINDVTLAEGDNGTTNFNFTVALTTSSGQTITVNYATANSSAQAGSDYQTANGMVTFSPGQTSAVITVLVNGDTQVEPNETFSVNLSGAVNSNIAKGAGVGTIVNDDSNSSSPTIQFGQANYSVQEDLGAITVTVTRSGDTSGAASVDYTTADGSAKQKTDFEYAAGTLTFAPGETSKTFTLLVNEDMFVEGNETFSVTLNNPAGAALGAQSTATVTITDDLPESITNPIDEAQAFVYTHYHDFLNREPDPAGLAFWTNQITSCGNDAQCIEERRINVSASFFLSIEFQETGYLLYLIQKESYATMPKYASFMRDLQEVSRGVIVNAPGWQQKLADNQEQFADQWVNRAEFKAAYDALSNDAYVSALYQNAGIVPPQTEKDKLVAALNAATMDRAAVLLEVASDTSFRQQEQNAAFVMMEYFGYLRRDPNVAPDSDYSGYNFWLNKLNQFGGNYLNAEMIKAFTTSFEYRQRFGQ